MLVLHNAFYLTVEESEQLTAHSFLTNGDGRGAFTCFKTVLSSCEDIADAKNRGTVKNWLIIRTTFNRFLDILEYLETIMQSSLRNGLRTRLIRG